MKTDGLSVKTIEVIGIIGLVASLIFVAYEIRQNTIAARATAIQQIGIATADMWGEISRDPTMIRLAIERSDNSYADWSADDWARFLAQMLAWSRLAETALLQVKEGLLPASTLELLGYADTKYWRRHPAFYCVWEHRLRAMVSVDFATYVESESVQTEYDCNQFDSFPFSDSRTVRP
jgi:hypothetical protein